MTREKERRRYDDNQYLSFHDDNENELDILSNPNWIERKNKTLFRRREPREPREQILESKDRPLRKNTL